MLNDIFKQPDLGIPGLIPRFGKDARLNDVISPLLEVIMMLAVFLAFIWFVWGAFHYIFAGGNKDELGKARKRMTWAIVGLIITLLAYLLAQFVAEILRPIRGIPI